MAEPDNPGAQIAALKNMLSMWLENTVIAARWRDHAAKNADDELSREIAAKYDEWAADARRQALNRAVDLFADPRLLSTQSERQSHE